MSKDIRFKKGANLNLIGKAEKSINNKSKSDLFALQPNDFFSLTPKLLVREGDLVSKGSAVFHDKNNI
ncbi:MAG: NADH:ubiquinone reductase (Na(+)-transporting) subunit A, partial [Flavobacteriaceae bacterium]|nr:NADH:ubiquinone reductase (Na(+)-transporting) subunit A [Flavobacteriaceae bacterium]